MPAGAVGFWVLRAPCASGAAAMEVSDYWTRDCQVASTGSPLLPQSHSREWPMHTVFWWGKDGACPCRQGQQAGGDSQLLPVATGLPAGRAGQPPRLTGTHTRANGRSSSRPIHRAAPPSTTPPPAPLPHPPHHPPLLPTFGFLWYSQLGCCNIVFPVRRRVWKMADVVLGGGHPACARRGGWGA